MKVLQVVMGISPRSGGPTRSVKGLCRSLSRCGVDVTLLVLHGKDVFDDPCDVKVVYGIAELESVRCFDLVHIEGLWDIQLHAVVRMSRRAGVPYVISTRGMLAPWALSVKRIKKAVALALYQRRDLCNAAAFHATAREEACHIRERGLTQPIMIAANGVDVPIRMPPRRVSDERLAVFMGRLHSGKGLLVLVEAWARVRPRGWKMRIVGPDSYGYKRVLLARLRELDIASDWVFEDAVDDARKWEIYREASLMIHPSVSENFGISIAEGLFAELPVICTKGTPWSVVEERHCGWWVDQGVDALDAAMREAFALSDKERAEMGVGGRKLIECQYLWSAIGLHVKVAYEKILTGRTLDY